MAAEDPGAITSWRDQAVARSLDPARARAEKRVQRFLDAAFELMVAAPGKDFTVQEVVERSGQSLRSFYQYFAGKYELGLALFEEAVRSTATRLRAAIADEDDPLERLHRFAVEYYLLCQPTVVDLSERRGPIPLADFAQQLLTEHPTEAARAFEPLVILCEQLLADAGAAGVLRPDLRHRHVAGIVLQAIMFNTFSSIISGSPPRAEGQELAEELWKVLLQGIGAQR